MSNFFGQLHDDTTSYPSHRNQATISIECQASSGHIRDRDMEKSSYRLKESFDFGPGEVLLTDTKIDTNYEPRLTVYSNVGNLVNPYLAPSKAPKWKFVGVAAQKSVLESHKSEVLQVFTSGLVAVAMSQENNAELCAKPFQHGDPVHVRFPTADEAENSSKIRLCHAPKAQKLDIMHFINGKSSEGKDESEDGKECVSCVDVESMLHGTLGMNGEDISGIQLAFEVVDDMALYPAPAADGKLHSWITMSGKGSGSTVTRQTFDAVTYLGFKDKKNTDFISPIIERIKIYASEGHRLEGSKNYRQLLADHYDAVYKIVESEFVTKSLIKLNIVGEVIQGQKEDIEDEKKDTLLNNLVVCHWLVLLCFNELLAILEASPTKSKAFIDKGAPGTKVRYELGFMLFLKTFQKFERSVNEFISKHVPCIGICRYPADNRSNGFMMVQLRH
jgi:hypothetical protein